MIGSPAMAVAGPEPVVKLQAGGLKCAEVMLGCASEAYSDLVQWVVGPNARANGA